MAREDNNLFHFNQKNYFLRFKSNDNESQDSKLSRMNKHVRHALEYFVDDLKRDQTQTIDYFLNQQTVNEIFLSIAQLLLCDDDRFVYRNIFILEFIDKLFFYYYSSICGNSAYIIGSTVETDKGLKQFLSAFNNYQTPKSIDIVQILCQLLTHADSDCVLNATGTLGTIVCRFQTVNL